MRKTERDKHGDRQLFEQMMKNYPASKPELKSKRKSRAKPLQLPPAPSRSLPAQLELPPAGGSPRLVRDREPGPGTIIPIASPSRSGKKR